MFIVLYLPDNKQTCNFNINQFIVIDYVLSILKIVTKNMEPNKLTWQLTVSESERLAIEDV